MRAVFIILACYLYFNTYCQIDNDSILYWNKETKLDWYDFEGKAPDSTGYQVALSLVKIYTVAQRENGMPGYKVLAVFMKNLSWSKDTSKSVLIHEQLHFDIGELFARKMRKAIFELREKSDNSIGDYLEALDTNFNECVKINDIYDSETAHGVYKEKQEEWLKKISEMLCELKNYQVDYSEYLKK